MEITIGSEIVLRGSEIAALHEHYSFEDKQARYQFNRMKKWCRNQEFYGHKGHNDPQWVEYKTKLLADLAAKIKVHVGELHDDRLVFPTGLYQNLVDVLIDKNIVFTVSDTRDFNAYHKSLVGKQMTLRRPQTEALEIVRKNAVQSGPLRGMGICRIATGVGKTTLAVEMIRHFGVRSIFLCPSRPILNQTYIRLMDAFGKTNVGIYGGGKKTIRHVTVATYQSVQKADPKDFEDFRMMLGDEVHHIAADTFFEVATRHLAGCVYRFGLSADEERADGGTILVEAGAGPVIYDYPASQAIKDGYLAQPTFIMYSVTKTAGEYIKWKTETKDGRTIRFQDGMIQATPYVGDDFLKAYKNWVLGNDVLNQRISDIALGLAAEVKVILILVEEKEHGEKLAQLMNAVFVYGGMKEQDAIMARFNARQIPILVATSTLGEGADTVPVDVLINLMGGRNPKQANGRALRNDPDPATGIPRKPTCMIIDFDFAHPVLHYHAEERKKIHRECGPVHELPLL